MKISDIMDECKLKLITGSTDREIKGYYACDLLSWAISHANEGDLWVTVMNNINILAVASLVDVACIVIPEDIEIPDSLKEKAGLPSNYFSRRIEAYKFDTTVIE